MLRKGTVTILAACVAALITVSAATRSSTVYVSGDTFDPSTLTGWVFNTSAPFFTQFSFQLGQATRGGGSLYVAPIANTPAAQKFIGGLGLLTPVSDFTSLSYDFLIGAGGSESDASQFYLNAYVNLPSSPATTFFNCSFDYVPATGSTAAFTTVTITPETPASRVRGVGCPSQLGNMPAGSYIRAIALNLGDTSNDDLGLDGYFDNVVVTTTSGETMYDFDPVPQTRNDCMKNGWRDYGDQFANQGQCVRFVSNGKRQ